MEAVYLVVNRVGPVLDMLTFVLDFNFLLVSSLLASLAWLLAFIYNLPHMVLTSLLHLGCGVVLSLLALIEALVRLTFGSLQALCTLLYSCYSGLESLKLLRHLASHGALRRREILHRGVLNVVSCSHALLHQACDIYAIAMSLVAYVINSLVNICLIGTQNVFSLVLSLWDVVMGPLWRMMLYSCYSGLESLKLLRHLASHGALRRREILHRGVLNVVSCSHALLHQACDIYAIAMIRVAYVINSLVNICLIGTQNVFSLVLSLWDVVMGPLWRMMDIVAAFLAHISSSAVAMAILLWTPCPLVLELLATAARLLASFMLVSLTGLALLACVLAVTVTVLDPDLTLRLATRALSQLHARPSYHRLREDVVQLSCLALGLEAWRRVWSRSLQLASWLNRGGAPGAPQGGPRRVFLARVPGQDTLPEGVPRSEAEEEVVRIIRATPARGRERLNEEEATAGQDPWKSLKEQEEWKKCVICQD
ncbi:RING finger protein 26 [Heterocephalus glaber]|uniref:RING finger protein 26 n=1 Tax=Heterocephalus glaber TaxID=10181 RepID=G5BS95_HETGA|nr:RING finger protein 26 [Heterocephalus glaber]